MILAFHKFIFNYKTLLLLLAISLLTFVLINNVVRFEVVNYFKLAYFLIFNLIISVFYYILTFKKSDKVIHDISFISILANSIFLTFNIILDFTL